MSIFIGDVVLHDDKHWVVAALYHSESMARIIHQAANGVRTSFTQETIGLDKVDSPSFEEGERVIVNGLPGSVVSTDFDSWVAHVMLDARTKPLRGGGALAIPAGISRVPFWQLVLENKMNGE
ncbi:hypothetical protein [Mesorhizobium sp. CN2-181]|uniref:hypothetical protein n=1 Tax=Mesorhizobium yinganensis TaxID=3157707 RepID=UPI0032B717D0